MGSDLRSQWESFGGKAPSHWEYTTLDNLLETKKSIAVGVMYPGQHTNDGVPLVKVSDVKNGRITARPDFLISAEKDYEYRRTKLIGNELLITLVGNPGDCVLVTDDMIGWNVARAIAALRLEDPSLRSWVRNVLLSAPCQHFFDSRLNTTVQKTLNLKDIRELILPIPPESEREYICDLVSPIEQKIELNRQMNETLEAMAQALFKSWFVDFDPVIDNALAAGNEIPEPLQSRAEKRQALGDQGKPLPPEIQSLFPDRFVFTDEMGWVPEGWGHQTIDDICEVVDCLHSKKPEQVSEDTGKILLQLNNIRDDGLLTLQKKYFITQADYKKWTSRIEVEYGDVVITNVGRVGASAIIPPNCKAAIGRNMTALRLRNKKWFSFLTTLLRSPYMETEIRRKTDVGTILNALNVKSIPTLSFVGSDETIQAFENITSEGLQKRQHMEAENDTLAGLRNTILPKLLSGELRISVAEKQVSEAV